MSRYAILVFILAPLLLMTGCVTAWTEGYQKAVYGHALEPGTPCKKGEVWVQMTCKPRPDGAS